MTQLTTLLQSLTYTEIVPPEHRRHPAHDTTTWPLTQLAEPTDRRVTRTGYRLIATVYHL
jgi:hypothetical protein